MKWIYDKRTETQTIGTSNNGCGLFKDGMFWYGNVVKNGKVIKRIPPTEDKNISKIKLEKLMLDLIQ